MEDLWATSGADLHLDVAGRPLRAALEEELRVAVRSGRLASGTLLPPSRVLAADLGISRNTVADAYGQLIAEGWLVARQGSGTRVAPASPGHTAEPPKAHNPKTLPYDLRTGAPDVSAFPRAAWIASARKAVNEAPSQAFGYTDPQGMPVLRAALSQYLARTRGVLASPDRLVVCSGFTQGLWILASVLRAQGYRSAAVESHGHGHHRDLLTDAGLTVTPLAVDELGAVPAELDQRDVVLLTPAHQFPIGVVLDPARRTIFRQWATQTGGLIIEDDYDGEFRYDRRPVGALQVTAPEHVAYLGTASKALVPGLRLGWLVLPAHLVGPVTRRLSVLAVQASAFDQLALAEFITSGGYDRHVRRSRLAYRRRRQVLQDALTGTNSACGIRGLPAGLHAVVGLPAGTDESQIVRAAAGRGLAVDCLSQFAAAGQTRPPALVVGFTTPPQHSYSGALARLTATLNAPA